MGRRWELNTVTGIFEEAMTGAGSVITVVGPAGIGKSRIVRETAALAAERNVPVYTTFCESHASGIPFRAISRLLRVSMGVDHLDAASARAEVRTRFPDAAAEDLILLEDLLGIRDAATPLPDVAPDARRRRLVTLINSTSLARAERAVYVIEDAHWLDDASEALLSDFFAVVQQTPSLVVVTYRPEYRGTLSQITWAQSVALRALSDEHIAELTNNLLGPDPALAPIATKIAERASGNPFFTEEIVRDLAERGVLHGLTGEYRLCGEVADVEVPATVQAAIAARVDRLTPPAKRTLQAASVIGDRFRTDLLDSLVDQVDVSALIEVDLVDQIRFSPFAEYSFRHPLIRAVAYESQLKAARAHLHRRLATAIESSHPSAVDENAALIAEHLESAGDLHAAHNWHMRAGAWLTFRDFDAAYASWRRAQQVADRLPDDDPDRLRMQIEPRSQMAGRAWRSGANGGMLDPGFEELRDLCDVAGDRESLALGMAGLVTEQVMHGRRREAAHSADELARLLEHIGNPTLTIALSLSIMCAKVETGEAAAVLRLTDNVVELSAGDSAMGNLVFEAPLALALAVRGVARYSLGIPGWTADFHRAVDLARLNDPMTLSAVMWYVYPIGFAHGVVAPAAQALRDTAELLSLAEQSGDDYVLDSARASRGTTLIHQGGDQADVGLEMLEKTLDRSRNNQFAKLALPAIEIHIAREKIRAGAIPEAIEGSRSALAELIDTGGWMWVGPATAGLVEALLIRGTAGDLGEARSRTDALAALPADPPFVLHQIWLARLRALIARAEGNESDYRDLRDAYRAMAQRLGFHGHIAMAEAMP